MALIRSITNTIVELAGMRFAASPWNPSCGGTVICIREPSFLPINACFQPGIT
ncbi:MAG: hypothetical protein E7E54_05160 [Varibaculum cambriense]|nr:hypothetical protein [Varibaculum cambriense]MDU2150669.1 hypothetical protein [Varibaculum cambriense]